MSTPDKTPPENPMPPIAQKRWDEKFTWAAGDVKITPPPVEQPSVQGDTERKAAPKNEWVPLSAADSHRLATARFRLQDEFHTAHGRGPDGEEMNAIALAAWKESGLTPPQPTGEPPQTEI
jgi:hypothetical protein